MSQSVPRAASPSGASQPLGSPPRASPRAAIAERVIVTDGAMGSLLRGSSPLSLEDFEGHEGGHEILNVAPEQSSDALIVHHPEAKYFSA